jgi:hypothetical protein
MSCESYNIGNGNLLRFSESADDIACLCTFPHNDGNELTPCRVRSLAYLGAMLMLSRRGTLGRGQYVYVPADLPKWMRDEIDRCVPDTSNANLTL